MTKTLFLILLLMFSRTSKAQMIQVKEKTSGYLGRYNAISLDFFTSPTREPQRASETNYIAGWNLNRKIKISIERILTNQSSISFSGSYSRTSSSFDKENFSFNSYWKNYQFTGDDNLDYHVFDLVGTPTIIETSYGIEYYKYIKSKGSMAPLGGYFFAGISITKIAVDLSPVNFRIKTIRGYHDDEEISKSVNAPNSSKTSPKLNIGVGSHKALSSRILLNYGIDFAFIPISIKKIEYSDNLANNIEYSIYKRMKRKQLINYYFGMSYVL